MIRKSVESLIAWHAREQRPLPWRNRPPGQRDAYTVWVSEVMAQQTRLTVVVEYFNRWMTRFPSVDSLAAADQQDVLKLWEGLGYYSRARNLHSAAQIVKERYDGNLPRTRRELLQLPGIGSYTAGAILSLAYGLPEPILDANAKRVFSRFWDVEESIELNATQSRLWDFARQFVEAGAPPGAVNEGVMELGQLLCRSQRPVCGRCPLRCHCLACQRGVQELRPVRAPRKAVPHYDFAAAVIWEGEPGASRLLIAQRPENGLLGGMWSFPGGAKDAEDMNLPACLRRTVRQELEIAIDVGEQAATVTHAFTHFRMTLHVFHACIRAGTPKALGASDWRWTSLVEIDRFPCPVPDRKVIDLLRSHEERA